MLQHIWYRSTDKPGVLAVQWSTDREIPKLAWCVYTATSEEDAERLVAGLGEQAPESAQTYLFDSHGHNDLLASQLLFLWLDRQSKLLNLAST